MFVGSAGVLLDSREIPENLHNPGFETPRGNKFVKMVLNYREKIDRPLLGLVSDEFHGASKHGLESSDLPIFKQIKDRKSLLMGKVSKISGN